MRTALSSAAAEHVATGFRLHTVTESMHFVLRTLFGLIRSFHDRFSFIKIVALLL